MNNSQRNFLIEKIEKTVKLRKEALEFKEEAPSLNIYILHAVMSGDFEIASQEEIKKMIVEKAKRSSERDDWAGSRWGAASKTAIWFEMKDFFKVPEEWQQRYDEWKRKKQEADDKIQSLLIESDTLITRIKLASNSTLESMIREVDDMGNISLMDTKLKQLTA